MAIGAPFENSATIGTAEYSLPAATTSGVPTSQTDDGCYQLFIDLSNLTATESYEFKVYEKITSGGSQRVIYSTLFVGASTPFVLPAMVLLHGWDMTMKKLAGTDRSISWSIRVPA